MAIDPQTLTCCKQVQFGNTTKSVLKLMPFSHVANFCGKIVYAEKMSEYDNGWLEKYFNDSHENQPLRGVAEPD
jgi:hypothetical protein